jgi:hypothetical protein
MIEEFPLNRMHRSPHRRICQNARRQAQILLWCLAPDRLRRKGLTCTGPCDPDDLARFAEWLSLSAT